MCTTSTTSTLLSTGGQIRIGCHGEKKRCLVSARGCSIPLYLTRNAGVASVCVLSYQFLCRLHKRPFNLRELQ